MTIRQQLLIWILAGTLLCSAIAGALMYLKISNEANELFDNTMEQMARAWPLRTPSTYLPSPLLEDYQDFDVQISGPAGELLFSSRADVTLPVLQETGIATVSVAGKAWRVYTHVRPASTVQIGYVMEARERVIAAMALRSLAPLAGFAVVLSIFIWIVVGRILRPLQRLAKDVRTRSPEALQPLAESGRPAEVRPIVVELNVLLARLDRALSAQRAFVADAAHELRTPLTALKLQTQLIERAKTDEQRSAGFAKLNERLDRATHLVQQLLNLARSEPQPSLAPRIAVSMTRVAQDVVAELIPAAESKHIDLGLQTAEVAVTVQGHPDEIRVLLENLVDNAIRYTPPGGKVDVAVGRVDDHARVQVTDTGPGIPAEERARVFERFHRRPGSGVPGSGLGLAIAKNIADQHQAKINLSSNPTGTGLVVTVSF
jgi:two-component system, OmpR family, sensor kinase